MEAQAQARTGQLPPGFRFYPTDEELIVHYLRNQATSRPCPVSIIPEVDIYKFDPWQLPEKAEFGENEWYFFTPRDRKYPNGTRPNRATVSGYWKATGTDKAIYSGSKDVGVKKSLVFYKGRPPKGTKSDWIMHEYRLSDSIRQVNKHRGSMRLDDWVLCRIYRRRQTGSRSSAMEANVDEESFVKMGKTEGNDDDNDASDEQQMMMMKKFPRTSSLTYLMELEYLAPISQLLNENTCNLNCDDLHVGTGHYVDLPNYQYTDSVKLEVNQSGGTLNQQSLYGNPKGYMN